MHCDPEVNYTMVKISFYEKKFSSLLLKNMMRILFIRTELDKLYSYTC